MTILVTGAAGFIGYHMCTALLARGEQVVGIDSLNDYYTPALKQGRLEQLAKFDRFRFTQVDIADHEALSAAVPASELQVIVHLAAQAGVRYSIENPHAYGRSNLIGHLNILELARHAKNLKHLVYASSSSVYGDREDGPFSETDRVRKPASLYAASKLSGEMLSESYTHLYGIPSTGLRFFTVYGAWGRPDMAYWIFTEKILNGKPIELFSPKEMFRDFTYIDDIIAALVEIVHAPPRIGSNGDDLHRIYNLGNSTPMALMDLVAAIENACGREAEKVILPKQMGDVSTTFADIKLAKSHFGYDPKTKIAEGIPQFVEWYRKFYNI